MGFVCAEEGSWKVSGPFCRSEIAVASKGIVIVSPPAFLGGRYLRLKAPPESRCMNSHRPRLEVFGSPTWTRTRDNSINSRMLYQLSYRGM